MQYKKILLSFFVVLLFLFLPKTVFAASPDGNGDGAVDIDDYVIWLNNYGKSVQGSQNGDFNENGIVDGMDYTMWLNNYGSTVTQAPTQPPVPTPPPPPSGGRNPDYGIWAIWGTISDYSKYPYLKGHLVTVDWRDIEPSNNSFNWSKLDSKLNPVLSQGRRAGIIIYHGKKTPEWIYSNGVARIETSSNGTVPHYTDPDFAFFLHRMIDKAVAHLKNWSPQAERERIAYIQGTIGISGDEIPWNGWPGSHISGPTISGSAWNVWEEDIIRYYTNAYAGSGINVLFNYASGAEAASKSNYPGKVDAELNWINNLNPNAYLKQGRPAHRFDMPGEKYQTEYAITRLRAQNKFTRGEQDHYSGGSLTGINGDEMVTNMYWNALWCLHVGIGQWNISPNTSKLQPISNHVEGFNFFNKYSGYNDPTKVPGAFIAFRDGLDATDTKRFPESVYGKGDISSSGKMSSTTNNKNRINNILNAFKQYGARQDDPANQFEWQVRYYFINGFNDVKWATYVTSDNLQGSGNYENFMTMIDPLGSSQGRWRVGPVGKPYHRYGREFNSQRSGMRLQLNNKFASSLSGSITIRVVWYDQGTGSWKLTYDASGNSNKTAFQVSNTGTNNWKEKIVTINDYVFSRRGPNNSDIGLEYVSGANTIFHMVEVMR
jgi:hypothetical protein